jgi:hypothetical protein
MDVVKLFIEISILFISYMQIGIEPNPQPMFECPICCQEYHTTPSKYKCTQCDNTICDTCFSTIVNAHRKCVFCRSDLDISEIHLQEDNYRVILTIPGGRLLLFNKYKSMVYTVISIFILWYTAYFIFLFGPKVV